MENKTNEPSRGLGDTVAKITKVTRIDKLANATAKLVGAKDCGCKRRQETLNKLVPYKNKEENK